MDCLDQREGRRLGQATGPASGRAEQAPAFVGDGIRLGHAQAAEDRAGANQGCAVQFASCGSEHCCLRCSGLRCTGIRMRGAKPVRRRIDENGSNVPN